MNVTHWVILAVVLLVQVGVLWLFNRLRKASAELKEAHTEASWNGIPMGAIAARQALRVDPDNPLWCVVHQVIEQQIQESDAQVRDADNQERPQLLSYYAGGGRALELLREFLDSEREAALREVEEEE